jgi:predicted O-methyltransferase YrrM
MKPKTKKELVGGKTPDIGKATGAPTDPWWSKKSIKFINSILFKHYRGFEFGGGMSTLWLAKRVTQLHTVENVPKWIERLQQGLLEEKLFNVSLLRYAKNDPMYANCINYFPDGYFDFIVIDGHQREECVKNSLPKLRKEGYLIIDDTNWPDAGYKMEELPKHIHSLKSWKKCIEELKVWSEGNWADYITEHKGTSVYVKP